MWGVHYTIGYMGHTYLQMMETVLFLNKLHSLCVVWLFGFKTPYSATLVLPVCTGRKHKMVSPDERDPLHWTRCC